MRSIKLAAIALLVVLASGCATGLNPAQEREYRAMEANNLLIKEKDPTVGAMLGLLPGFGSFYAREPAYGVLNLIFYPFSILWDPISGYQGSKAINYDLSKQEVSKKMAAETSALDLKLAAGSIKNAEYLAEKQKIQQKYALE